MPLVKSVSVLMKTEGYDDAKLKIDRLKVASEELAREKPEIKPQIDKTKALLEARLLRDGIKRELAGSLDVSSSKLSLFEKLFQKFSIFGSDAQQRISDASGVFGNIGAVASSPEGLAAVTAAAASLLVEVTGIVSGFAAAGAGVGAFGLLALPTFNKIKNAYTTIDAAQKKYNAAVALNKENPTT